MNRSVWTVVGFVLFAVGILSLILSLVGLRFSILGFLYGHGVVTLIVQLLLLFGGMIILYVARTEDEEDEMI